MKLILRLLLVIVMVMLSPVFLFMHLFFSVLIFAVNEEQEANPFPNPISRVFWIIIYEIIRGEAIA